jgi:hypothetical protein
MHTFTVKVCHSAVSKTLHYGASTFFLLFYYLKAMIILEMSPLLQ